MQKQAEEELYVNKEHARGVVTTPVPEWFRDLSLDHKLLGCLCQEIKVHIARLTLILSSSSFSSSFSSSSSSSPLPSSPFLSPLYPGFQKPADWLQYELSSEQVEQFWRDGYLSNIRVLSDDQCDKLLKEYSVFLVSGWVWF